MVSEPYTAGVYMLAFPGNKKQNVELVIEQDRD